jgi:hypothetical protein
MLTAAKKLFREEKVKREKNNFWGDSFVKDTKIQKFKDSATGKISIVYNF